MIKKTLLATGAAVVMMGTRALAADLSFPPMPPMPEPVVPRIEVPSGGWYLRGDVGVGIENYQGLNLDITNPCCAGALNGFSRIQKNMNDKTIIGTGLGYQWNDYLRFDVTGEYRGANTLTFTLAGPPDPLNQQFNLHHASHSAVIGLVNGYYDIGTFWGLMPFVGAGVGFGRHKVTGFEDVGEGSADGGYGLADPRSTTRFAWALHAGLDYEVTQNLKLEMSYRYLNEGNVGLGTITCFNVASCADVDYTMRDLTSHDLRIGMRWAFGQAPPPPPLEPPPVMRKY